MNYECLIKSINELGSVIDGENRGDETRHDIFVNYIKNHLVDFNKQIYDGLKINLSGLSGPAVIVEFNKPTNKTIIRLGTEEFFKFSVSNYDIEHMIVTFDSILPTLKSKVNEYIQSVNSNYYCYLDKFNNILNKMTQDYIKSGHLFIEGTRLSHTGSLIILLKYEYNSKQVTEFFTNISLLLDFPENELKKCIGQCVYKNLVSFLVKKCKQTNKLNVNEKYWLVNYALENMDYELASLLNTKRSKLHKNLKQKLDAILVANNLISV